MRRRSNVLVMVGLLSFVLGLLAVYLVTRDDDDGSPMVAGPDTIEVLVATDDLAAGTSGDDLLSSGGVELRRVSRTDVAANALTTQSQLSNTLLLHGFSEGEQIVRTGVRPRSVLAQQVELPAGFEAVAVDVETVAAGAGYVTPGDRVNVYLVAVGCEFPQAVNEAGETITLPMPYSVPRAELLLTNVSVLDISQTSAPLRSTQAATESATAGRAEVEGATTMLLALQTVDVEKVVLSTTPGTCLSLYVSLVNEDAGPAGPTGGIDWESILAEEANDAYARSNPG